MFFKRLLTQCIMLAGPVLFFLLNQLACIPLGTALIFGILLSAAAAVILMLVLIRSIQRQGELLLFRYNLGFSIEEAGILYDFQTVMLLLVSLFVFTAVFFLILPPEPATKL